MSLTQHAYERIKNEILMCELSPGEQIGQAQLRERLKMGLTPVREALQRLTHDGLVQPIPRFGYIVSPVTLADIKEIYELRCIVEIASVRLAAERADDASLNELSASAEFTYTHRDRLSYTEFLNRNAEFHGVIAAVSGNQRLAESVARLLDESLRVFHLGLDIRDSAEEMRDEHLALTAALLARDPERAAITAQDQIIRSQQRVVEALLGHTGKDLHLITSGARR
jgi:DNA-binding GntR family transcriptional regulator